MDAYGDAVQEEESPLEARKPDDKGRHDSKTSSNDIDTGWAWVVLAACFGNFCLFGCAQYTSGIIHSTLLERYNASVYLTSWAGSLHAALISLAGPLSSAISDRYSCRVAIVTGGVLYIAGYVLTALAPSVEIAIITCGVISGIGGGIAYSANTVVVSYNFRKKRTLAMGIAHTGIGVGVFALAPLMQFLREFYGSFGFFIMLAGIFGHMIVFGVLCFPNSVELNTIRHNYDVIPETRKKMTSESNRSSACSMLNKYWNVFSNKGIFCLCISNFFYGVSIYVLFLYFPNFIEYKGFTATQASFFLSISGILNIFGRLGSGIVGNMQLVNVIYLFSGTIGMVGVSSIVYPFIASHFAGHVAYFVALGLFMGPCYVYTPSVTLKFVGVEYIATAIGLEYSLAGVGATLGPVVTGLYLDNGGTYEQAIIIAGACSVVGAVLSGITVCFKHRTEMTVVEICDEEKEAMMVMEKDKTGGEIT